MGTEHGGGGGGGVVARGRFGEGQSGGGRAAGSDDEVGADERDVDVVVAKVAVVLDGVLDGSAAVGRAQLLDDGAQHVRELLDRGPLLGRRAQALPQHGAQRCRALGWDLHALMCTGACEPQAVRCAGVYEG